MGSVSHADQKVVQSQFSVCFTNLHSKLHILLPHKFVAGGVSSRRGMTPAMHCTEYPADRLVVKILKYILNLLGAVSVVGLKIELQRMKDPSGKILTVERL